MPARSIPFDEWRSFFKSFGPSHQGWLASLDIARGHEPASVVASDMPLADVSFHEVDHRRSLVSIDLGTSQTTHVKHTVRDPVKVVLDLTEGGADEGIHIESAEHTVRLRFRVAALPETLDGVVLSGP